MATFEAACELARSLPRVTEGVVRDSLRFRIGSIVWLAFSADEAIMGFAFPKEERALLVDSEPDKFVLPRTSDLRYNWCEVRLAAIDDAELEELVCDAWRMCVPKKVAREHFGE
ncbi:MAG: MmcQ/YjbR family DNA-binding protein [Actinomycetota bacterium]|nr:MmcQ/YjbR family DNA-binding protein [Actinomycetota bacterium]